MVKRSKKRSTRKYKFGARARAFVKKTRAVVKKTLMKESDLKWNAETASVNDSAGSNTQRLSGDVYMAIGQGVTRSTRLANEINMLGARIQMRYENNNLNATTTQDQIIYLRFMVFQPRLMVEDDDANTAMDAVFNSGAGPRYMWGEPPHDSVNMLYDSGVKFLQYTKCSNAFKYKCKGKRLHYTTNSSTLPQNRRVYYYLLIYNNSGTQGTVHMQHYMSWKDL